MSSYAQHLLPLITYVFSACNSFSSAVMTGSTRRSSATTHSGCWSRIMAILSLRHLYSAYSTGCQFTRTWLGPEQGHMQESAGMHDKGWSKKLTSCAVDSGTFPYNTHVALQELLICPDTDPSCAAGGNWVLSAAMEANAILHMGHMNCFKETEKTQFVPFERSMRSVHRLKCT